MKRSIKVHATLQARATPTSVEREFQSPGQALLQHPNKEDTPLSTGIQGLRTE
jgi:hypothetical protein